MRNMSVSLYAHTDRFLLQGYAFLFHKQNRNLAPSFPQTHTDKAFSTDLNNI